jgi:multidrug efflux pump subunit AcrA (membrane-fusion protein)
MRKIFVRYGLCLLLLASCHKNEIHFQTFEVTKRDLTKKVEANGSVETDNTVDVYTPVPGRLEHLIVKEGDMVKAHQKIGDMSSDARTAIVDMASGKSADEVTYYSVAGQCGG